jgi:DNA-binding NarL/FixJ family response regulator
MIATGRGVSKAGMGKTLWHCGMMGDRIKVLLADDDELFLESLRTLIEGQPELSVVATAQNGLEAIELADRLDPDAVVIDLHMPLVDGVSAVARLRRDHPSLCLIVATGDADRSLHLAADAAGADEVLEKHELARGLVERLANVRR